MGLEGWAEGVEVTPAITAWVFPEANVIFTKSHLRRASEEDAHGLIEFFLWLSRELDVPAQPPAVVHDWRSMRELSMRARRVFVMRRREVPQAPRRMVVALDINPLLRMAMQAVALSAQILAGAPPLELVDHPLAALRELGVGVPDPDLHTRLRFSWRASRRKSVMPPSA